MNEFSAGAVLSRSLSVWAKNVVAFLIIAFLVHLPVLLYTFVAGESFITSRVSAGLGTIIGVLCANAATGAITYGVLMQLRGEPASIGRCISVGLGRMLPILGVALCVGLAAGLGTILLIVPGIIILTMLYVAVPIAVVEKPGVFASLNRSAELTKGYRWSVFGIVVVQFILGIGINLIISKVFLANASSLGQVRGVMMILQIVSTALASLWAVFAAVCYHDLKVSKEGVNIDQLISVFS